MARIEAARRRAMSRRERIEAELDQLWFTVPEAAEVLGEHPKTLYRRIKNGEIKANRPSPRKTRILYTDLAAYIAQESGGKSR